MNNLLNILPKQAKFDLKCSKMRWQLGELIRRSLKPLNRERQTTHHSFLATPLLHYDLSSLSFDYYRALCIKSKCDAYCDSY